MLEYASADAQGDSEVVSRSCGKVGHALQYASADVQGYRVVLEIVRKSWPFPAVASADVHGDREVF